MLAKLVVTGFCAAYAARCVEVAAPYKCVAIKLCGFRGRMIFVYTAHFFTIHFHLLL